MAKHIHIFLGPKVRAVTTDSPEWEESKHPRASNGRFGKGSGGGGKAPPDSGSAKPGHGGKGLKTHMGSFGSKQAPDPKAGHGGKGFSNWPGTKPLPGVGNLALKERQAAKKQASEQKMAQFNKQKTMMKGVGLTPAAAEKQKMARQQEQAGSGTPAAKKPEGNAVAQGLQHHHDQSEATSKKFPVGSMVKANVVGAKPEKVTGHSGNMIHTEAGQNRLHASKAVPAPAIPKHSVRGYVATAEKSQFGGYRPHVTHPDGSTTHLSQHSFETPEQAADYAEYLALTPGVIERGVTPAKGPHHFPGFIKR